MLIMLNALWEYEFGGNVFNWNTIIFQLKMYRSMEYMCFYMINIFNRSWLNG